MRIGWFRAPAVALAIALIAAAGKPAANPPWPHGDPNLVIRHVLAAPAYRTAATTSVARKETLLEFVRDWIGERVRKALLVFFQALRGSGTAGAAFGIGLIIAIFSLLILLVVRIARFFTFVKPAGEAPVSGDGAVESRSSQAWLVQSRTAAERGEYASAIAALFNAALRRLDERNLVTFDGARSPAEYRALVRRTIAPATAAFDTVTRCFVVASFSKKSSGVRDYEEARDAYDSLEMKTA